MRHGTDGNRPDRGLDTRIVDKRRQGPVALQVSCTAHGWSRAA